MVAWAFEPAMSCRQSRQSKETDSVNFATSAAGGIRVEIQDEQGRPLPGFALADAVETIGNEIDRVVRWRSGSDLGALAGTPVRLRFVLKDARLYALRFRP